MRSAARSFPAASATPSSSSRRSRIYKPSGYVGTPDFLKILLDTAEKAGKDVVLDQARAGVRRGAAGVAARRACRRAASTVLQCYAIAETGVIAYESEAREGMIVNESLIVEIVRPGTGDPVRRRRGRRGGRHLVQSRLSDDPARDRRSFRGAAGRLALRPHQHAHQGLDGPRRPDHQGQGHVRASRRRSPRSPSAIPSSAACGSSSTREAEQDAMTLHAECARAGRRRSPTRSRATLQSVTKVRAR